MLLQERDVPGVIMDFVPGVYDDSVSFSRRVAVPLAMSVGCRGIKWWNVLLTSISDDLANGNDQVTSAVQLYTCG